MGRSRKLRGGISAGARREQQALARLAAARITEIARRRRRRRRAAWAGLAVVALVFAAWIASVVR